MNDIVVSIVLGYRRKNNFPIIFSLLKNAKEFMHII